MSGSRSFGKPAAAKWFREQPPDQTILDMGCGKGNWWRALRRTCNDVWEAVEINAEYIEMCRVLKRYGVIHHADIRRFRWRKRRYDLVILGDVLEHMPKADAIVLVAAARRHARMVLISIPVCLESKEIAEDVPRPHGYDDHIAFWTYGELTAKWPDMKVVFYRRGMKLVFLLKGCIA